ncbi:MAG: Ig-like domain-containing protein, partial [Oscillospiraceae bacterium]|nr:Ig-like domain-containing protein [Oscillospiraceae bacterium]
MKKRILSLLLAAVMLLGAVPRMGGTAEAASVEEAAQVVCLDFAELAKDIAGESWWNDLPMGARTTGEEPDADGLAQYQAVLDHLNANEDWTIDETATGILTHRYEKMLWINTDPSMDWSLRFYSNWLSDHDERNGLHFSFAVAQAGWYEMSVEAFMEAAGSTQAPGDRLDGSGSVKMKVNGEVVFEKQPMDGPNVVHRLKSGYVYLDAGVNTVSVHATNDIYGGVGHTRRTVCLNDITFTPVTSLKADFKESVLLMSERSWWADLRDTDVEGIKVLGDKYMQAPTEEEYAAFQSVQTWLSNEGIWNIVEGSPAFNNIYNGRYIFLNTADDDYGLRFYPHILNAVDDRDRLILSVQAPEAGLYHFDLTVLNEALEPTVAQVNGTMGGAYGDIYVNDVLVCEDYFFGADSDCEQILRLGAVELVQGENTVTIEVTADTSGAMTTSRRGFNLKSMEFIPLKGVQAELGRTMPFDLRATYLPFDAQLSPTTHTVTAADASVVEVSMEDDGGLLLTGRALGNTTVTLKKGSTVVCSFPVTVAEATTPENGAYFTIDGFKAVLLPYGEEAQGETVCYRDGRPMNSEEALLSCAIYYVSSDESIARVDAATGRITAVGEGIATVTAYVLTDGVVTSDAASVTVTDDTDLAELTLSAPVDYVGVGNELQLSVTGRKASGAKADLSSIALAFSVDDTAKAAISDTGRISGIEAGQVTAAVSVGVRGEEISSTLPIDVVANTELAAEDVIIDFTDGRVLYAQAATLEENGYQIVMDACYKGGAALTYTAKAGLRQNTPVGEKLVLDILIAKDGWYRPELTGGLFSYGSIDDIFLDGDYMGTIDFTTSHGAPYGALCQMNTVYLTAGVHRLELVSLKKGDIFIGEINFYHTQAPASASMQAQDMTMLVGQTAQAEIDAVDSNGQPVSLKAVTAVPTYDNYYILTSSAPGVAAVSGTTITAKAAGTATITARGKWSGKAVETSFTVTVTAGKIAEATLTGEQTTLKPGGGSVQLTFSAVGVDGKPVSTGTVTYRSEDTAIATVSGSGLVTVKDQEGSAKITATVSDGGTSVTAACWITVTAGKTEPTLYTYEERENARYNANTYDWAISMKNSAVTKADYYVEHLDQIYNSWIREGIPRSTRVGLQTTGNTYRYCRYCKADLVAKHGVYPWIVDPIENPWKVTCPECERDFPSNDFESYYKSGLDEQGYFSADRADSSYLVNELYPEMGEGWGVDAGPGYYSGQIPAGFTTEDVHTYMAYYVHCVFDDLGSSKNSMHQILDALREAYLYTGEEVYGNAGAILLDRLAEIYPEYKRNSFSSAYPNSDGNSGMFGKFVGCIWEAATIAPAMARAADAFWPCMGNDEVVTYLREHATFKGESAESITPETIRANVDNGILLEIKKACEDTDMSGNFGMQQSAMAHAAVALGREPEASQMLEWVFRYGDRKLENGKYFSEGGAVLYHLVDLVDRDGFGNEVSYQYNSLWCANMMDLADALEGCAEEYDLWKNPKFVNMFSAMSRLVICGRLMPQVGEAGFVQSTHRQVNVEQLTQAFANTGDRELARALYAGNGNTTRGLHADIFTEDPESGLQEQIRLIVNADGPFDYSDSDMMSGFGIAILREGPAVYEKGINESAFSDYWMYFGTTRQGHSRLEMLAIDMEAFGLGLSSSMGYPLILTSGDPERMQWVNNTVSHNTVVVNDHGQSKLRYGGFPLHFADDGRVKVMDAEASGAYPETDIYRRTVVAVEGENGVHYAVDFFRVLGGSEHVYSFHGATTISPETVGLELVSQPMGTYAGPDIPFGDYRVSGEKDPALNLGAGYSWLDGVRRDKEPDAAFSVDFAIEDFHDYAPDSEDIHLKFTMVSDEPMTEVAIANGHPPQNGRNPEYLKYLLVRRSGKTGMDTLFSSVIEPYKGESAIASVELVPVELTSGTEKPADRAAAVKVTGKGGRVDYVVYATNADCTYRVADLFDFKGFTGVASFEKDALTYAWGSEVTTLGTAIMDAQASVSGTVTAFTEGLADRYTVTISMTEPVAAETLTDRYLYVDNDGSRNAAYRIYGAQVEGNTATLDLYTQTLVRGFADKEAMELGYVHNISVGDTYTIPLSAEGGCSHPKKSTSYAANNDGTHLVNKTCTTCGQVTESRVANCSDTNDDGKCNRCNGLMPVQIATADELIAFAARVSGGENKLSAVLTADIDLGGTDFAPIGTVARPYRGVFDGSGHTVTLDTDHTIASTNETVRLGLFGTAQDAVIRDVRIMGQIAVSGEAGSNTRIGGLVGSADGVTVEDCRSFVTIRGDESTGGIRNIGGLIGYGVGVTVMRCGSGAVLEIPGVYMGGLVGQIGAGAKASLLAESFFRGALEGRSEVGGLVGMLQGCSDTTTPSILRDCYTTGTVTGSGGSLVGSVGTQAVRVYNCFAASSDPMVGACSKENKTCFDNIYCLEGTSQTYGKTVTAETLAGESFVGLLGAAFRQAGAHPNLVWECVHTEKRTAVYNGDRTHTVMMVCEICGDPLEQYAEACADHDSDRKCDVCGTAVVTIEKFSIAGSNMTLGNELEVNFLFLKKNLTGTDNVAIVTHHMADGTTKVTEIPQADWGAMGSTYHKVSTRIAAKEMADTLTIEIVDADGYVLNNEYSDSARGYAG